MPDKARVNVYVERETKSEWEEYVEHSPEVNSVSQLVRLGVTRFISSDTADTGSEPTVTAEVDSELNTAISRVENKMDEMWATLNAVKSDVEGDNEFGDPQQIVYAVLPTRPDDWDGKPLVRKWAMTPEDVAGIIGADESDVKGVLERLDDISPNVQVKKVQTDRSEAGATNYYFKIED